MKKTLGIIGGMGPLATADLFRKIVEHTAAASDQEHLHIIIDNNTDIPDRSAALLEGGADPLPQLCLSAERLTNAGAELIIMPCNTAHSFHPALQAASSVPVLNMISATRDRLLASHVSKAALLGTTGTLRTGVYDRYFDDIELIKPNEEEQQAVMDMIYKGVKAGAADFDASRVQAAAERLMAEGAEVVILGCTELPPAMELYGLSFPAIDPTLELARAAIIACGGVYKD